MMGKGTASKFIRGSVVAATVAASTLMLTQTALAAQGGSGEGKLAIYNSPDMNSGSVAQLKWGHTYYIVLEQPGGKVKLWNEKPGFNSADFNFFSPTRDFSKGDPTNNWKTKGPTFDVTGTLVTNTAPYFYKITLPGPNKGNPNDLYSIETGPLQMDHTKGDNTGNDSFYFSTGAATSGVTITPETPEGQLPEVPYAGIIPVIVLAGGGLLYLRRRRKVQS